MRMDAEIVGADAFQIYRGLDLLTAKPERETLAKVPHHLVGAVPLTEELNAEKFRRLALDSIEGIHARDKNVIIVGGSGLYIKALTHGFTPLPAANRNLREQLSHFSARELFIRLQTLDPKTAQTIDRQNPRRLIRAIEICLLTGKPVSHVVAPACVKMRGVFVFRDREELHDRINRRVETIFANGVVEEVRKLGSIGATARTNSRPARDSSN